MTLVIHIEPHDQASRALMESLLVVQIAAALLCPIDYGVLIELGVIA